MAVQIDSTDVVKVVLQFLKENNLNKAFTALQEEADVGLNAVKSIEGFVKEVKQGKWDVVLPQVAGMKLPVEVMMALYEQVIKEMIEIGEKDTARALLRSTAPMTLLKSDDPARYSLLERLLMRPVFDETEAYAGGSSKSSKRAEIAESLKEELVAVPPQRLLAVIGQSMKWQQHLGLLPPGMKYDIFRAAAPSRKDTKERVTKKLSQTVRFASGTHPTAVTFSPDGQHLIAGSNDGLVEVYDFDTGKVDTNIEYQEKEEFIMLDDAVMALACSPDGDSLAAGCRDGSVSVWDIHTGRRTKLLPSPHPDSITTVCFSRDCKQLLTGSLDGLSRLHGLVSGKMLKEFRGHSSFLNDASFSPDMSMIVTASSDGSAKLWDVKSSACIRTINPPQLNAVTETVCNTASFRPRFSNQLIICNRTSDIYLMDLKGELILRMSSKTDDLRFISATASPKGKYCYAIASDGSVWCFNMTDGKLEATLRTPEADGLGVAVHPHQNLTASFGASGVMRLWRNK